MTRQKRDRYSEAGEAMRDSLAQAVDVKDRLRQSDWRVLHACFALTASYSKISDAVSVKQIAELAGLGRTATSESLGRLHAFYVIYWKPGSRRGSAQRSRLTIGKF